MCVCVCVCVRERFKQVCVCLCVCFFSGYCFCCYSVKLQSCFTQLSLHVMFQCMSYKRSALCTSCYFSSLKNRSVPQQRQSHCCSCSVTSPTVSTHPAHQTWFVAHVLKRAGFHICNPPHRPGKWIAPFTPQPPAVRLTPPQPHPSTTPTNDLHTLINKGAYQLCVWVSGNLSGSGGEHLGAMISSECSAPPPLGPRGAGSGEWKNKK